jgi:hypothetical protein
MLIKLTRFFNSYQCGWDSLSAGSIASHFRIPASIMDGDGLRTYLSIEELTAKFERNCDSFKAIGYRGSEFLAGCYTQNGENAATVDLGWRIGITAGFREFRTTYLCVYNERQWRILSAVAYEGPYAQAET